MPLRMQARPLLTVVFENKAFLKIEIDPLYIS